MGLCLEFCTYDFKIVVSIPGLEDALVLDQNTSLPIAAIQLDVNGSPCDEHLVSCSKAVLEPWITYISWKLDE